MTPHSPPPTRKRSVQLCVVAAASALSCAALVCAAALVPAPPAVLLLIVVICIAVPMLAAWELPRAVAGFRRHRERIHENARAVAELRARLAELPETSHPLGL
jgi:hypothetical protein